MNIYCVVYFRAFLEIHVDDMLQVVDTNAPHWEEVYYVINFGSSEEMNR